MGKILIVDDSPAELIKLRTLLTDLGHHTVTATSGAEAVQKAQLEKPQMILMDIVMPDMDGYEACRRLQSDPSTKTIPLVFVSSKNQRADHLWAQMQGAKALVSKPYESDQITNLVKTYV
jgi:twitching motility two-component system response regulator PilH